MKKATNTIALLFVTAISFAQTNNSMSQKNNSWPSSSDTARTNRNGRMNKEAWLDTTGLYRWYDTGYYRRNRGAFDSLIRERRTMWNEQGSYFLRSTGDTINPYNRQNWVRDSIRFSTQNWDSLHSWQKDYRWGDDMNANLHGDNPYNNNATWSSDSANLSATNPPSGPGANVRSSANNTDSSMNNSWQDDTAKKMIRTTTRANSSKHSSTYNPGTSTAGEKDATLTKTTTSKTKTGTYKDRVFMKDNMLMVYKNGASGKVSKSIKLKDGTVVMADGTIKMPDGSSKKLKNGESILLDTKAPGKQ